jgi:glycosyltransferase involved in cell wall biosynthesis
MRTRHLLTSRPHPVLLSIVIPIYNEQDALPYLRERLTLCLPFFGCETEVLLVNDGSVDDSLDHLVRWAQEDRRVHVLNFARNFGHQAACTAGMDEARGDAVVLIDADLQDPPEVIADMLVEYRATTSSTASARRGRVKPPSSASRRGRSTASCGD